MSLIVALLCRTSKEANTALRFVILVPMFVSMFLVFFPDWMGRAWFVVPIVGQQARQAACSAERIWPVTIALAVVSLRRRHRLARELHSLTRLRADLIR